MIKPKSISPHYISEKNYPKYLITYLVNLFASAIPTKIQIERGCNAFDGETKYYVALIDKWVTTKEMKVEVK